MGVSDLMAFFILEIVPASVSDHARKKKIMTSKALTVCSSCKHVLAVYRTACMRFTITDIFKCRKNKTHFLSVYTVYVLTFSTLSDVCDAAFDRWNYNRKIIIRHADDNIAPRAVVYGIHHIVWTKGSLNTGGCTLQV